jgi:hypothetical protein
MVPNPVFKKSVDIYALGVILHLLLETQPRPNEDKLTKTD